MSETVQADPEISTAVLDWLRDPGPCSPEIRHHLLGELFTSPLAIMMGLLNGLILNVAALFLHYEPIFVDFLAIDVVMVFVRLSVLRRARNAFEAETLIPVGEYFQSSILWSALQGAMAFEAMRSGSHALQVLSACTIFGLLGPLCARNYAAPRFAMLLVSLCGLPLVAGAVFSPTPWLWILIIQTPLFLIGCVVIVDRFKSLSIAVLEAGLASQYLARHDPLTGLLNRSGFDAAAKNAIDARPDSVALLCLDLDGFKQVNDQYGHQAGDDLLRSVADRLRSALRTYEVAARLGGDEFIILSTNIDPLEADRLAERILTLVAGRPYQLGSHRPVSIGISIGIACASGDAVNLNDLRGYADTALYDAKAAGRGAYRRAVPTLTTLAYATVSPTLAPVAARA